jgi:hypothetical protein
MGIAKLDTSPPHPRITEASGALLSSPGRIRAVTQCPPLPRRRQKARVTFIQPCRSLQSDNSQTILLLLARMSTQPGLRCDACSSQRRACLAAGASPGQSPDDCIDSANLAVLQPGRDERRICRSIPLLALTVAGGSVTEKEQQTRR